MARAPTKPVSDKSLYLWLSAVLGVWIGLRASLSLNLPMMFAYRGPWKYIYWSIAVILASSIIAAAPTEKRLLRRIQNACWSYLVSFVCACVLSQMNGGLYPNLPDNVVSFLYSTYWDIRSWYGLPTFLVRFIGGWALLFVCSLVFRLAFRRFTIPNPIECRFCRFDQSGLPPHEICPECGRVWDAKPLSHRESFARTVRWFCLVVVVLAIIGRIIVVIPVAVIQFRYFRIAMARSDGTHQTHGLWGGRSITRYTILEVGNYVCTLEITLETRGLLPGSYTSRTKLTSRIYAANPSWDEQAQPILEQDGLIPRAELQKLIDAPPNPPDWPQRFP